VRISQAKALDCVSILLLGESGVGTGEMPGLMICEEPGEAMFAIFTQLNSDKLS
jgi:hypothetical protein